MKKSREDLIKDMVDREIVDKALKDPKFIEELEKAIEDIKNDDIVSVEEDYFE